MKSANAYLRLFCVLICVTLASIWTWGSTEIDGSWPNEDCSWILTGRTAPHRTYQVEVINRSDVTIMKFSGSILLSFGVGDVFKEAFDKIPADKDLILVLDSTGGSSVIFDIFARDLDKLLRPHIFRTKKNRKITTYVPDNAQCTSACLRWFMIGDRRVAHPNAKFGFHGVGDIQSFGLISAGSEKTIEVIRKWGVAVPFLNQLGREGVFDDPSNQATRLNPYQLMGSNILTEDALDLEIDKLPLVMPDPSPRRTQSPQRNGRNDYDM